MAQLSLRGQAVETVGVLPAVGQQAKDFKLISENLEEKTLNSYKDKYKILNIFPSLETQICATSVKKFYGLFRDNSAVIVLNISKDLPFAMGRFCRSEDIENVAVLSAYRSTFSDDYGLTFKTGPLQGLCSRVVMIFSPQNEILYHEQVAEINQEPNYDNAAAAILAAKNNT